MQLGTPVRWQELSWEEIAALREGGIDMAILPVGATEQHGPHLPTGVDTLSATAVAEGVSARTGIPVLPALPYGCSPGHSDKWPGTLSLRPETLAALVLEIAGWLCRSGFTRLVLLNGHVTNWAPLRCALENIRADLPDMRIALRSIWEISADVRAIYEYDGGTNWHANDAETSLMLHLRPELVDLAKAVDEPNRAGCCFFSYTVDKESVTGTVGRPSAGTAEFGARLLDLCVTSLAGQLESALVERTPLEDWTADTMPFPPRPLSRMIADGV
ncbi:creatininase family protein [Kaistia dalseonensis]|uniref:Creatinine amidohydrolase n=1 Tax=Kaistia dalseonensis TaxID=410840 RepID=A0ABU0H776_9HYPH|nr:creatininase family protein [Kaistia dalseonensis]MCX5495560.1 creatininase family protein [Kaistia dalseonensis]MDQ0438152.1 creatinine amidohydrolase [Kaistia dalseonensis]